MRYSTLSLRYGIGAGAAALIAGTLFVAPFVAKATSEPTPAQPERISVGDGYIEVPAGTRQKLREITFGRADKLGVEWPVILVDFDGEHGVIRGYQSQEEALAEMGDNEDAVLVSQGDPDYETLLGELRSLERRPDRWSPSGG